MRKIRIGTVVVFAILAVAATAFAQSTAGQPGMPGQQAQPAMPPQPAQPANPGQQAPPDVPPQSGAAAQPGTTQGAPAAIPPSSAADRLARRLASALNLNDKQTEQIRSTLENEHTQLLALRDNASMSTQDKQAKLMEIRRTTSDKVMSILTPAQQNKLADLLQAQPAQNSPGQPPAAPQQQTPASPPR